MPAAPLDELPAWGLELLRVARVGRLGLTDDRGAPRVLPVTYALHQSVLWTAVDDKPKRVAPHELARVRWLRERPAACLCVDRYDDEWEDLAWVQVLGEAEVLDTDPDGVATAALAQKYPPYRERPPEGPFLRLVPARTLWWPA
jgi:PPOX class probable F420-dependent enzyme